MHPEPSIPAGLAHLAAELFGSLIVVGSTMALIAAAVFLGGGTGGGAEARLIGATLVALGAPGFLFGRFLINQHSVSSREPPPRGGGGPPPPPPRPSGPSVLERHVAARRAIAHTHPPGRAQPRPRSEAVSK